MKFKEISIKIKSLYENSIIPTYANPTDSGMDLHAYGYSYPETFKEVHAFNKNRENVFVLNPGQRILINTGISIELPPFTEVQIRARSGLALKKGIGLVNGIGTIDEGYSGSLGVVLYNYSDEPFEIGYGDRIAQMVVMPVLRPSIEVVGELSKTSRGESGFGSTGV